MWDFGRTERLEPEAIGEPGHRTFRLRVQSGSEAASIWLEKEQLTALALAIRQLLEQTASGQPDPEPDPPPPAEAFPEQPVVDFKIGRLGIGYEPTKQTVVLFAYAQDAQEDAPPTFSCQVTRSQCLAFAERAGQVVNAGRPICLLCGGPIDPAGHLCPRRNGHVEHPIPPE